MYCTVCMYLHLMYEERAPIVRIKHNSQWNHTARLLQLHEYEKYKTNLDGSSDDLYIPVELLKWEHDENSASVLNIDNSRRTYFQQKQDVLPSCSSPECLLRFNYGIEIGCLLCILFNSLRITRTAYQPFNFRLVMLPDYLLMHRWQAS
jgi:hypothetical protein